MADYLIHFNRNHNPKNGQFDFGDGDGDGIRNDHSHRKESFGQKVKNAVSTYDKVNKDIRKRTLDSEKYKVKRDDLRLQQDEIAKQRASAKNDEKRDRLELDRYKTETKADIRMRKLEEKQMRRQMQLDKMALKREQLLLKSQMRADKEESAARKAEQKRLAQERANVKRVMLQERRKIQAAERKARAEKRAYEYRQQQKGEALGQAVIAGLSGRPITAMYKLAGAVGSKNRSGLMRVGNVLGGPLYGSAITINALGKGFAEDLRGKKF